MNNKKKIQRQGAGELVRNSYDLSEIYCSNFDSYMQLFKSCGQSFLSQKINPSQTGISLNVD